MADPLPKTAEVEAGESPRPLVGVDGHAHYHRGWPAGAFLDTAATNLAAACSAAGGRLAFGALLLAAPAGDDDHDRLRRALAAGESRQWRLDPPPEAGSLVARRPGWPPLAVVAGRQLRTAEGLEVLALACPRRLPDGLPLASACAAARAAGALVVVPWSLGKWWGRRGRLLAAIVAEAGGDGLLLGDTALRPRVRGLREPLFALAASRGVAILPGSDPLPLPSELRRVGGCGFALPAALDPRHPAASLRRLLAAAGGAPEPIGEHVGIARALGLQLALRATGSAARGAEA